MNKKRFLKMLTIIVVIFIGSFCFYKFMTYDRNYVWAKEYINEVTTVAKKYGFNKVTQTDGIFVTDIKRSKGKVIKIRIQKMLSGINLMNYGHEFGENTTLTSDNYPGLLNCKAWCLDDHLIGLEIEYSKINNITFKNLHNDLDKEFDNYKIIWTPVE